MAELNPGAITPGEQVPPVAPSAPTVDTVPTTTPISEPVVTTPPVATTPTVDNTVQAEIDRLNTELAQSRTLQAQADRRAQKERAARVRAERAAGRPLADEPADDQITPTHSTDSAQALEREKAQRLMFQKAYSDPKFRAVVEADPTLAHLIVNNPLALVKDPVDAEDAAFQLEELLLERIEKAPSPVSTPQPAQPTQPVAQPVVPQVPAAPEFKAGAVNPVTPSQPDFKSDLSAGRFDDAVLNKINDPAAWSRPGQQ